MKKALIAGSRRLALAVALVVSATGASYAQTTADQTVPGYYANAPQTGCTVGPCFVPYGQTVPVSGTFSASLAGFSPTAGATANLSVSNVSSSVNLPAGADVVITNTGATDASFRLTTGAGTAVTTDQVLKAGAATGLHVLTQTVLSAITASSTTTLNVQGGTGLASGYGGGGSSAGGGTSVAQGSTTAGQSVSPMGCRTLTSAPTDTTAQTNMPWCTTKGSQVVAQPTAADLNVTAAQGGTWTVQPGNTANTTAWKVDGSAVTQPTSHASGSVASGAYASGSIASGAIASGAVASGAVASGALAAGAGTDGWDSTQGAKADSVCGTATGTCTLMALVKFLNNAATASTPAGTNAIGTVQPGTTPACGSVLPISQITSTDLHTASGKTYICSMLLVVPDAEVVSLVEGTGTVCATGTAALVGATTAANGMSFAANGGAFSGGGGFIWLPMQTTSDHLCLLQSGSGRIAGVITYNDH